MIKHFYRYTLVLLLTFASTTVFADQVFNVRLLGFSSNGIFAAYYQYTQGSESDDWIGLVEILNIKTNKVVTSVSLTKEYNTDNSKLDLKDYRLVGEIIANDLLKRLLTKKDVLKQYAIIYGNTGYLAYHQPIWGMPEKSCVTETPGFSAERGSTMTNEEEYRLQLRQCIPLLKQDSAYCAQDLVDGSIHLFELKLLVDDNSYTVFQLQKLNKKIGCPFQYAIGRVYFYGEKTMVIFVHYTLAGYEGPNVKTLVIGVDMQSLY